MDFELTSEQKLLRDTVREYAKKEIEPQARENDENATFPHQTIKDLSELGILGMEVSEENGGNFIDTVSYAIVIEELAKVCPSTAIIVAVHNMCCFTIETFGTKEQKEKYLPVMASGSKLGAFALTEPGVGSDAGSLITKAELSNGNYIVNGSKCLITNGGTADVIITYVRTDKELKAKGISTLIVEKGAKGFQTGKKEDKMGMRASDTYELFFDNCEIPAENMLGELNKGLQVALITLDASRIGVAAQCVGIAQGALDEAIKYSKERIQFGKPISSFQAIQWMLAEMAMEINAARLLTYQAACLKDKGGTYGMESSMAKLYASTIAVDATRKAVQIHGGYGCMKDYKVERLYRDAKVTEIYEGTSEIQKLVISRNLLMK